VAPDPLAFSERLVMRLRAPLAVTTQLTLRFTFNGTLSTTNIGFYGSTYVNGSTSVPLLQTTVDSQRRGIGGTAAGGHNAPIAGGGAAGVHNVPPGGGGAGDGGAPLIPGGGGAVGASNALPGSGANLMGSRIEWQHLDNGPAFEPRSLRVLLTESWRDRSKGRDGVQVDHVGRALKPS